MEPRIQYVRTADEVSIAFWALGEGLPFVILSPLSVSHVQLEWEMPEYRRWYEYLAKSRKVVRYDSRGFGLSDRDVNDFSLDGYLLDLEAVVDGLGLEKVALFVVLNGPVGVAYAVRHPERVSHLILWCARARFASLTPELQWERLFVETNWELFTETMAHHLVGWSEPEVARRMAQLMRESVTREHMHAFMDAWPAFDVTALLPEVRVPTLVLHRRQVPTPDLDSARVLAARIPDARLVILEGASIAPFLGDVQPVMRTIDEFLGIETLGLPEPLPVQPGVACGLVTILFIDVKGSTSLTQRLGDAAARELLRTHERIVREALQAHGGSEVKALGDGFMASFPSATGALECAIAMQRAFAAYNETAAVPIPVRIGLNAGEPIVDQQDLFGLAVIAAARIATKAEGGEILVANVVRELVAGKGFLFSDRGEVVLQGFEEPVRLYEVRWREPS
ncbi:MAG: adenylate/guanylate cyclase domain-containing protein [Dehalococcoidia bacterium]